MTDDSSIVIGQASVINSTPDIMEADFNTTLMYFLDVVNWCIINYAYVSILTRICMKAIINLISLQKDIVKIIEVCFLIHMHGEYLTAFESISHQLVFLH